MSEAIYSPVVIAGAGPAGAATSIFLTKAGIHHILLDKAQFPRDKVCGDGFSGKTTSVIRKANPEWEQELFSDENRFLPSNGIVFVAPNGKPLDVPFYLEKIPGKLPPGFTATRTTFDQYLFDKTASPFTQILQRTAVKEITRTQGDQLLVAVDQNGVTKQIVTSLIVGADGDKSVVKRQLHNRHNLEKSTLAGLRAYYTGVTDLHPENFIELHFLSELLPGYFWIFPLPNGLCNVGVGMPSDVIRRRKINLRELMIQAIENNPDIRRRFAHATLQGKIQGWGLPVCMKQEPISGDNYLLTGDAASLVDPFSGEGIGNALYSGMKAAKAIEAAINTQKFDADFLNSVYDKEVYGGIGKELQLSAVMQKLCKYPWLFNFVVNKANKSPSLRKTLTSMFANIDLRSQLRNPAFYLRILFNR